MLNMNGLKDRYEQRRGVNFLRCDFGRNEWVVVAGRDENGDQSNWYHSVLIPMSDIEKHQNDMSWTDWECDRPTVLELGYGDNKRYVYDKGGYHEGEYEDIVYKRTFISEADTYYELSQEFVLFFNLYYDSDNKKYLCKLNNGDEETVALYISDDRKLGIKIKLNYLIRFASAKQKALMFIANLRFTQNYRDKPEGLEPIDTLEIVDDGLRYLHLAHVNESLKLVYSEIRAKKIIKPLSVEFAIQDTCNANYGRFIVNVDEYGRPVLHTCHPEGLQGVAKKANSPLPDYDTVVYFKKSLLDRYYRKPDIYIVGRSSLSCSDKWGISIWPYSRRYYVAYLKDIGTSLPLSEHSHWMQHNVACPADEIEARGDEELPFVFMDYYREVQRKWMETCGWSPYLEPVRQDATKINTIRLPLPDDELTFSEVLSALTVLLVDYLNEKEIKKRIETMCNINELRGINRLSKLLEQRSSGEFCEHMVFLHSLYRLRSNYTAHRKKTEPSIEELQLCVGPGGYEEAIVILLRRAVAYLQDLLLVRNRFILS